MRTRSTCAEGSFDTAVNYILTCRYMHVQENMRTRSTCAEGSLVIAVSIRLMVRDFPCPISPMFVFVCVWTDLVLEHELHEVHVARESCELQRRRPAVLARRVHVCPPLLQQHARTVVAALVACCIATQQWRGTDGRA
jgi:hypothetical protein